MSVPLTQAQINAAHKLGAYLMLRCQDEQLSDDAADVVVSIALATAISLYGDDYTDDQLGVCVLASKAAYLVGYEKRTMFAGYG